jgi:cytoskeletal protein RodZ
MNHQEHQEHHKKEREREVAHDKHKQEETDVKERKGQKFPRHFWLIGLGVVLIFVIVMTWIVFVGFGPRAG